MHDEIRCEVVVTEAQCSHAILEAANVSQIAGKLGFIERSDMTWGEIAATRGDITTLRGAFNIALRKLCTEFGRPFCQR
jgi:hypothetical protein